MTVKILDEKVGCGAHAYKGCMVHYSARLFLNRGDEVTPDRQSIEKYGDAIPTITVEGVRLIEHKVLLGKRRMIAGVEKALLGMAEGGYRKVLVPPHLAYGETGLGDLVPPNALLTVKLWLHAVSSPPPGYSTS